MGRCLRPYFPPDRPSYKFFHYFGSPLGERLQLPICPQWRPNWVQLVNIPMEGGPKEGCILPSLVQQTLGFAVVEIVHADHNNAIDLFESIAEFS
ncbi:hypothetical protein J6590_010890 [Homalodisca vitripennis]|nr:hypothetical protein J6590_010890 [Homalodisca vitripennis]